MTRENWLCRGERDAVSRLNTVTVVVGRMRENGASFSLAVMEAFSPILRMETLYSAILPVLDLWELVFA